MRAGRLRVAEARAWPRHQTRLALTGARLPGLWQSWPGFPVVEAVAADELADGGLCLCETLWRIGQTHLGSRQENSAFAIPLNCPASRTLPPRTESQAQTGRTRLGAAIHDLAAMATA